MSLSQGPGSYEYAWWIYNERCNSRTAWNVTVYAHSVERFKIMMHAAHHCSLYYHLPT